MDRSAVRDPGDGRRPGIRSILSGAGSVGITAGLLIRSAVVLLAVVLRVRHLDRSLNIDEVRSVLFAGLDWGTFFHHLASYELNMAPYYVLLRFWLILGSNEVVVRAFSVAAAVLTLPVLWMIGVRFFNRRVGFYSLVLLALSPMHIRQAENARGYALAALLVALSSFFYLETTRRPSRWSRIGYVLTSVLAVYTQFHAGLVLLAQWLALPFLVRTARGDHQWRAWLASIGTILLLLVPVAWFAAVQDIGQISWITRPDVSDVIDLLKMMSGGRWSLMLIIGLLCAAALLLRDASRSTEGALVVFLLAWFLMPVVLSFAFSMFKPVFLTRYLVVSLPAVLLLAAVGFSKIRWAAARLAVLAVIVVLSAKPLVAQYHSRTQTEGFEQWMPATRLILSDARQGDAIFFQVGEVRVAFDYYAARLGRQGCVPAVVFPADDYLLSPSRYLHADPAEIRRVLKLLPAHYRRVWLVLSHERFAADRRAMSRFIEKRLASHYSRARESRFHGVRVVLFER